MTDRPIESSPQAVASSAVESDTALWAPPRRKTEQAVFVLCAILFLGLIYVLVENRGPKAAPQNAQVKAAIADAKALQKQGKLEESLEIFEKHALQGYPEAMYLAGRAYSRGWGAKPDLEKARHYFLLAVQYDFPDRGRTAYATGRLFQRSQGPDCNAIAVEWFKKSLRWGFVKASLQLSMHYDQGLGVKEDLDKAVYHYEIAIRAGFPKAALNYAQLLQSDRAGIAPDHSRAESLVTTAIETFERRALRGSSTAAKQLARLYRDGELLPESHEKAYRWFLHAATLGSPGGMHDLANFTLKSDPNPAAIEASIGWLKRAAARGHGGAMTALGRFHLSEKYGLTNGDAVAWFRMGVGAGHAGSMEELGRLYAEGKLVEQDLVEAGRLAMAGSLLGHTGSKSLLADLGLTPDGSSDEAFASKRQATDVGGTNGL